MKDKKLTNLLLTAGIINHDKWSNGYRTKDIVVETEHDWQNNISLHNAVQSLVDYLGISFKQDDTKKSGYTIIKTKKS